MHKLSAGLIAFAVITLVSTIPAALVLGRNRKTLIFYLWYAGAVTVGSLVWAAILW